VTDIFFSYKSADRDRVQPIHSALVAEGFDVFWDQKVPAGQDWDKFIRGHLTRCKCAIVFWSRESIGSDNVRHEATVAKDQGKLITVLLEPITAEQFPMGLYIRQAVNLPNWKGDLDDAEWKKLCREVEDKLTPLWVRHRIAEFEAELEAQRGRLAAVVSRDKVLRAQIAREAQVQEELKQQRDRVVEEASALKTAAEDLTQQRDKALQEVSALNLKVDELRRKCSEIESRAVELSRRLSEAEARRLESAQQLETATSTATEADSERETAQRGKIRKAFAEELIADSQVLKKMYISRRLSEAEAQRLESAQQLETATSTATEADSKRETAQAGKIRGWNRFAKATLAALSAFLFVAGLLLIFGSLVGGKADMFVIGLLVVLAGFAAEHWAR
jgi:hypothetical protein